MEQDGSSSLIDVSLYTRIDDALTALDVAFQSLVSAGLAQNEEERIELTEKDGVVVYAREIGVQASAALQAISRLKQTSIQSDWKLLEEQKKQMKNRMELDMENVANRLHKLKQETRNLVKSTEDHFRRFPKLPQN